MLPIHSSDVLCRLPCFVIHDDVARKVVFVPHDRNIEIGGSFQSDNILYFFGFGQVGSDHPGRHPYVVFGVNEQIIVVDFRIKEFTVTVHQVQFQMVRLECYCYRKNVLTTGEQSAVEHIDERYWIGYRGMYNDIDLRDASQTQILVSVEDLTEMRDLAEVERRDRDQDFLSNEVICACRELCFRNGNCRIVNMIQRHWIHKLHHTSIVSFTWNLFVPTKDISIVNLQRRV
mmetsp:Transcript_17938/g.36967  ORF Transcript_17938/g.36967 Transcript_17938/m.36967 type:complete len:231 (-) Transcript_17938:234-926(-)